MAGSAKPLWLAVDPVDRRRNARMAPACRARRDPPGGSLGGFEIDQ